MALSRNKGKIPLTGPCPHPEDLENDLFNEFPTVYKQHKDICSSYWRCIELDRTEYLTAISSLTREWRGGVVGRYTCAQVDVYVLAPSRSIPS